jgi:hypothetical protein
MRATTLRCHLEHVAWSCGVFCCMQSVVVRCNDHGWQPMQMGRCVEQRALLSCGRVQCMFDGCCMIIS